MAGPKRATGANVLLRGKFATEYGEAPTGNFFKLLAYSYGLKGDQPLEENPLLGQGRDPLPASDGALDVAGSIEVPIDHRLFGNWLKLLLGDPVSSDLSGARGFVEFKQNPSDGDTITLDGVVWTFVAGVSVGSQTQIGASVLDTVTELADDLNASANVSVNVATYSADGTFLQIRHDTADASGDSFTLAKSSNKAKLSGATLVGGGFRQHIFHSAQSVLPDMALEVEHTDLEALSDRFVAHLGVMAGSMTIPRQRSGPARATVECIAQDEQEGAATIAGVPVASTINIFSHFQGVLRVDGAAVANVTAGSATINNNMDVSEDLRDDGLIGGADPGGATYPLSFTARFSNNAFKQAAKSKKGIEAVYGFRDPVTGAELRMTFHHVRLPRTGRDISGPAGIQVDYAAQASQTPEGGRALTVELFNDVAGY